jgi:hypothetical protein
LHFNGVSYNLNFLIYLDCFDILILKLILKK